MRSGSVGRLAVMLVAAVGVLAPTAAAAAASTAAPGPASVAQAAYDRMTPQERVGQLFMIGVDAHGASTTTLRQLGADRAGNVYLSGRSGAGRAATAKVVAALRAHTSYAGARPWVATDQEGGEVQVLSGPGFDRMPTALAQGGLSPNALYADARRWAGQLHAAGVDLDLGPVADTVPRNVGTRNQPIGRYDREFGYDTTRVGTHVAAFVDGLRSARVATAVKHFPGLGRASGNTDTAARVTDPTTASDNYLKPFTTGIQHGTEFVMMSSAIYPNIDPNHRACFSPTVIGSLLRGREHFDGIVVSDSFSARSVAYLPTGQRAVQFLAAGGTMILDASAAQLHPMATAVLAQAARSGSFARVVRADVLRVLTAKARAGLLG